MILGQLFFDGLAMGLVFVVLATGMVLITSVNKILFMAYGMFYTIGSYVTWYVIHTLSLPFFLALPIGMIGAGVVGMLCYLLVFKRLRTIEGGFLASLIASMGLQTLLSQANLLTFGTTPRSIPAVFKGTLVLGGINISYDKIALILVGIAVTVLLFLVYEKTRLGRSMRALSFLPEAAALQGMNVDRISMLTLGLGCALAGVAGGILSPTYGISPSMGNNIIWTVMLMIMLGGMDSLLGAVAGGVVIGQLLSFGQFYIGGSIQVFIFLVIGIILRFRPNGLLGRGIDIGI